MLNAQKIVTNKEYHKNNSSESVLNWLKTVARRQALDVLRKSRGTPGSDTDVSALGESRLATIAAPAETQPAPMCQKQELVDKLRTALTTLESDDREIITRVELQGEMQRTLALERGVSDGKITKLKQKALARLRTILAEMGITDDDLVMISE